MPCIMIIKRRIIRMRLSRNFFQEEGSRPDGQKTVWTFFFFFFFFFGGGVGGGGG